MRPPTTGAISRRVQPNPNLPGRLKRRQCGRDHRGAACSAKPKSAWQIETNPVAIWSGASAGSAKPKSAWQIETFAALARRQTWPGSAKPKSAWQIETERLCLFGDAQPLVQPNPNLPGRLKHGQCGRRAPGRVRFSQTQICLAD